MQFSKNNKKNKSASFKTEKKNINELDFWQKQKNYILRNFLIFPSEKLVVKTPYLHVQFQKYLKDAWINKCHRILITPFQKINDLEKITALSIACLHYRKNRRLMLTWVKFLGYFWPTSPILSTVCCMICLSTRCRFVYYNLSNRMQGTKARQEFSVPLLVLDYKWSIQLNPHHYEIRPPK